VSGKAPRRIFDATEKVVREHRRPLPSNSYYLDPYSTMRSALLLRIEYERSADRGNLPGERTFMISQRNASPGYPAPWPHTISQYRRSDGLKCAFSYRRPIDPIPKPISHPIPRRIPLPGRSQNACSSVAPAAWICNDREPITTIRGRKTADTQILRGTWSRFELLTS
jgi:hypothetical protein